MQSDIAMLSRPWTGSGSFPCNSLCEYPQRKTINRPFILVGLFWSDDSLKLPDCIPRIPSLELFAFRSILNEPFCPSDSRGPP